MKQRRTFEAGKRMKRKLAVPSFTLERLDGKDELAAVARAGEDANGVEIQEELVADAICAVGGESVARPYRPWSDWDARTRSFVRAAFNDMHAATPAEMAAFLASDDDGLFQAKGLGLAFESIRLVAPPGRQELAAIRRIDRDKITVATMQEELIGAAIVEVNGEVFGGSWSDWDIRTRTFVRAAHERVTSMDKDELEDFLRAGRGEENEASAPG